MMTVKQISLDTFEVFIGRAEWWTAKQTDGNWSVVSYRGKQMSPNGRRAKQIKQAIADYLRGQSDGRYYDCLGDTRSAGGPVAG
jgi:hypothetical protein